MDKQFTVRMCFVFSDIECYCWFVISLTALRINVGNDGYHLAEETGMFYRAFEKTKTKPIASRICSSSGARVLMPKTKNDIQIINRIAGL